MKKLNKKGLVISLLIKIIFAGIILTIIANMIFDPNYFHDAADFINNLFEPPEADPLHQTTRMLTERENAFEYLEKWVDAFDAMKHSEHEYCYMQINATTRESREADLAVLFFTEEPNSFNIRLAQQGATVSRHITIDSPLCLIAQPNKPETNQAGEILSNFRNAFYSNNQNEINNCLNNPKQCTMQFSNPSFYSNEYTNYESFHAEFQLNSEQRADRRTSFSIRYRIIQNNEPNIILDGHSGILSDAGYLLFKIKDNYCIMPLANSWRRCEPFLIGNSRSAGDINILRRVCFFESSLEPNQALKNIPECKPTESNEEETEQDTTKNEN